MVSTHVDELMIQTPSLSQFSFFFLILSFALVFFLSRPPAFSLSLPCDAAVAAAGQETYLVKDV